MLVLLCRFCWQTFSFWANSFTIFFLQIYEHNKKDNCFIHTVLQTQMYNKFVLMINKKKLNLKCKEKMKALHYYTLKLFKHHTTFPSSGGQFSPSDRGVSLYWFRRRDPLSTEVLIIIWFMEMSISLTMKSKLIVF